MPREWYIIGNSAAGNPGLSKQPADCVCVRDDRWYTRVSWRKAMLAALKRGEINKGAPRGEPWRPAFAAD